MFRAGRRLSGATVDAYVRAAAESRPRVGVVVPRHGRTIVERNRLRRRLLEVLRLEWLPRERVNPEPRDLLLRPRSGAYDLTYDELRAEVARRLETAPC